MNEKFHNPDPADQHLWHAYKAGLGEAEAASSGEPRGDLEHDVDLNDLASWMDGNADESIRQRVEAAIVDCNDPLLNPVELLAMRQAAEGAEAHQLSAEAKARIVARAAQLVESTATERVAARPAHNEESHRPLVFTFPFLRKGLAAAAAIVICALGWHAGQSATATYTPQVAQGITDDVLITEMSFGILATHDELNLFALDLNAMGTRRELSP